MFRGTKDLKPKEFSEIIARQGGEENAFTSWDYTAYHQTVAADRLELVMKLEADRMQNLVISEEQLKPERDVVLEEWRMRIGNQPSALLDEQVQAALYLNHPYRIPVLGWMNEIKTLDVAAQQRRADRGRRRHDRSGPLTRGEILRARTIAAGAGARAAARAGAVGRYHGEPDRSARAAGGMEPAVPGTQLSPGAG
jgi:hypothetical protein